MKPREMRVRSICPTDVVPLDVMTGFSSSLQVVQFESIHHSLPPLSGARRIKLPIFGAGCGGRSVLLRRVFRLLTMGSRTYATREAVPPGNAIQSCFSELKGLPDI